MEKPIVYLIAATGAVIWISAAQAQGISNARDGNGNLVERGAATRSYPATPMANSRVVPPSPRGSITNSRSQTLVIPSR